MQSSCPCAHVWSERLAFSCGSSRSLRACPRQARDRHSAQVVAFAKSSKRLKYSHSSDTQTRGEPLFVRVQPDGSDIWRLDAIVGLLKSGAVSRCTANSCVLGCLHLSVVIVEPPFGQIAAHIAVPHLPIHICPVLLRWVLFPQTPTQQLFAILTTDKPLKGCTPSRDWTPKSSSASSAGICKISAHTH